MHKKQSQINRLKENKANIQMHIELHSEELGKLQVEQKMVKVAQTDLDQLMNRLQELEEAQNGKSSAKGKKGKKGGKSGKGAPKKGGRGGSK